MIPDENVLQKHFDAHREPKKIVSRHRVWKTWNEELYNIPISGLLSILKKQTQPKILIARQKIELERRITWLNSVHPWRSCFGCHFSVQNDPCIVFNEKYIGWGLDDTSFASYMYYENDYKFFF